MTTTNPAFDISGFSARYGIGRSKVYDEISSGRLRALKIGRRTVILETDAQSWLASLPAASIRKRAG